MLTQMHSKERRKKPLLRQKTKEIRDKWMEGKAGRRK
jgi:hypothetical protein